MSQRWPPCPVRLQEGRPISLSAGLGSLLAARGNSRPQAVAGKVIRGAEGRGKADRQREGGREEVMEGGWVREAVPLSLVRSPLTGMSLLTLQTLRSPHRWTEHRPGHFIHGRVLTTQADRRDHKFWVGYIHTHIYSLTHTHTLSHSTHTHTHTLSYSTHTHTFSLTYTVCIHCVCMCVCVYCMSACDCVRECV